MAIPAAEVEGGDRCHHGRQIDQDCDLCESEERARENAGCGRLVLWGA